jgi:hypothetical protein
VSRSDRAGGRACPRGSHSKRRGARRG